MKENGAMEPAEPQPEVTEEAKGRVGYGRGCLIALGVAVVMFVAGMWTIGEPVRRARAIAGAIERGQTLRETEGAITGRATTMYYLAGEGVDRETFVNALDAGRDGTMRVVCLGFSPNRASLYVTFEDGQAAEVSRERPPALTGDGGA